MVMDNTVRFSAKMTDLARLTPPSWFSSMAQKAIGPTGSAWMERNGMEPITIISAGYTTLMTYSAMALIGIIISFVLLPQLIFVILMSSFGLMPLLATISVLHGPARQEANEEKAMLAESPAVIGMMSMSMHLSPSLERAVSYASENGDGQLSLRLRAVRWTAMTDWKGDLSFGMMELSSSLGDINRGLRQSLHMIMTATAEKTRGGLERLLDRANDLAVKGVQERLDQYIASLSFPTMVIFAFGVLLPVMLFSLVPMLTIRIAVSQEAATPALGMEQIGLLMLVIFPVCTFLFARSTLARHPFRDVLPFDRTMVRTDLLPIVGLTGAAAVGASFLPFFQPFITLFIASVVPALYAIRKWRGPHLERMNRPKAEEVFIHALYQVGNGMLTGSSFESALLSAAKVHRSSDFAEFVRQVMHQVRTGAVTLSQAMGEDHLMLRNSRLVRNAYMTIAEASSIDPEAAGRTAINLAKYIWELRESERKGRERMRSVVDMMSYTAMIFAPIVLAVTGSLYTIVSMISPMGGSSSLALVGGIYVLELTLVVTYFNQGLQGSSDLREALYQFSTRAPIAMGSFVIATLIAQEGLVALF
jgi:hypothetical protein